jgi:hypothetical protein
MRSYGSLSLAVNARGGVPLCPGQDSNLHGDCCPFVGWFGHSLGTSLADLAGRAVGIYFDTLLISVSVMMVLVSATSQRSR